MRTATKWAIGLFAIHTLADIGFLIWMGIETDGLKELGVIATAANTADIWFAVLYKPLRPFFDYIAYGIKSLWPTHNELTGYIILIFIPFGGAIYAGVGWLIGRTIEKAMKRS